MPTCYSPSLMISLKVRKSKSYFILSILCVNMHLRIILIEMLLPFVLIIHRSNFFLCTIFFFCFYFLILFLFTIATIHIRLLPSLRCCFFMCSRCLSWLLACICIRNGLGLSAKLKRIGISEAE